MFSHLPKNFFFFMKIKNLLILFCLCFLSCKSKQRTKEEKFDKTKWATMNDGEYPHRNQMLNDLISNYKLKGLKKDQVEHLLGHPNRIDSGYLFYTVDRTLFANFFVLHAKTLVIKLSNDSTVEWRKIHE
jgi:hypothetical protein